MKQIFLAAIVLFSLATFAEAQSTEPKQKTITVTGTAETEVVPDEIYVQVDLREYDKRGVGKISLDNIKSDFLAACKSIDLQDSDISVQSYGANNSYWQLKRSRKKDPDLKAGISYIVKLTTTKTMDDLVDKLDDETTQNFFIARVDYSKRIELKKQLKINAIKAAKDKAVYLTEAINEHLSEAITINDVEEQGDMSYHDNSYLFLAKTANSSSNESDGNDVGFKKIKYQFQVSVVFALQ
jgi:uncharacterized protein YggE